MTKVVFKGATVYEYIVDVQDYKLANVVSEDVTVIVERMQEHWSVQRVDEYIEKVQHV